MPTELQIDARTADEARVLRLAGTFDGPAADGDVESLLGAAAALPSSAVVVVDLRGLEVLTASGARTLQTFIASLAVRGQACRLVLAPGGEATEVLRIAGLPPTLEVFDTLDHALGDSTDTAEYDALGAQFAALTSALLDARTVAAVLHHVVAAGAAIIPGADLVSVTLRAGDGEPFTPAATDETATEIDQVQYRTGQGPCLDAADPAGPAYAMSEDLTTERRWPSFVRVAIGHGLGAVLATDLQPARGPVPLTGALNVYTRRPHGLSARDRNVTLLLATHASLALAHAHATELRGFERAQLREAINSRDVIGQAKGILMARQGLTADQAFGVLRDLSQDLNVKLIDIAHTIASRHSELELP